MIRIISFLSVLLLFIPSANANPATSTTTTTITASVSRVLELINIERGKRGLIRLIMDEKLSQAAHAHAVDMSHRKYFSHTSPNGIGMSGRLRRAGASYTAAGENIARGHESAASVVSGWMHSPGHRRNILRRNYRKVGIARFNNYWVQDFSN